MSDPPHAKCHRPREATWPPGARPGAQEGRAVAARGRAPRAGPPTRSVLLKQEAAGRPGRGSAPGAAFPLEGEAPSLASRRRRAAPSAPGSADPPLRPADPEARARAPAPRPRHAAREVSGAPPGTRGAPGHIATWQRSLRPGARGDWRGSPESERAWRRDFRDLGTPSLKRTVPRGRPQPPAPARPCPARRPPAQGWPPAASQAGALSRAPRRWRAPGPRPRHGGAAALLRLRRRDHGRL